MKLSERLKSISNMVDPCDCICDIGADHAYIPIDLISRGIVKRAVASDVRKGPCEIARKNINENNLADKIEIRMGDGFEKIGPGECDTAVIAGLGGYLMIKILEDGGNIPRSMNQIVIQPQNSRENIREYLYSNGYDILNEALAYDEGKFYTVMSVKYTGVSSHREKIEFFIGKKLIENKDKHLKMYLDKEIKRLKRILKNTYREDCEWLLHEYEKIREGEILK